MGLGLLGAPVVALVVGPVAGVLVINVVATVNAVMQSASVWENIDWRKFWLIGPVMALGALPGTWVVHNTPLGPLQMIVGALVLLALLVTSRLPERARVDGPQYAVAAGVGSPDPRSRSTPKSPGGRREPSPPRCSPCSSCPGLSHCCLRNWVLSSRSSPQHPLCSGRYASWPWWSASPRARNSPATSPSKEPTSSRCSWRHWGQAL